jgi:hypothetical protein
MSAACRPIPTDIQRCASTGIILYFAPLDSPHAASDTNPQLQHRLEKVMATNACWRYERNTVLFVFVMLDKSSVFGCFNSTTGDAQFCVIGTRRSVM